MSVVCLTLHLQVSSCYTADPDLNAANICQHAFHCPKVLLCRPEVRVYYNFILSASSMSARLRNQFPVRLQLTNLEFHFYPVNNISVMYMFS